VLEERLVLVEARHYDWPASTVALPAVEGMAQPAAALGHVRPGRRPQTRIRPPKAAQE
jgi:hypothetical protein